MDVETITMDPAAAREQLRAYRTSLHRRADAEYQRVAAGLEHLERGRPLLVLSDVIATAPRDAKGRPRLAIARADRRQVKYDRWRNGTNVERFDSGFSQRRGKLARDAVIEVPVTPNTPPRVEQWAEGYALVPLVPPDVRGTRDLSRHFILWEVEAWVDRVIGVDADRDPYLLERIDVDLYAVVAEWDLTELERAITRGRREGAR